MSNQFPTQNRSQVIVPLRFTRAGVGAPREDSPDIDHRAWQILRPTSYQAPAVAPRGGFFAILQGETVRVKISREHLDSGAALYLTKRDPSGTILEIVEPAAGRPIAATGMVRVRGAAATPTPGQGSVLEVRLGAADGPILSECEVRVMSPANVAVQPYILVVNANASPGRTAHVPAVSQDVYDMTAAIWKHAGVNLQIAAPITADVWNSPHADSIVFWGNAAGRIAWAVNGHYTASRINVYFVRYSQELIQSDGSSFAPLGIGLNRIAMTGASMTNPGIMIAVDGIRFAGGGGTWTRPSTGADHTQELANDMAHEIGHFLTLSHFGAVNGPGRDDSYARRNLMHPNNLLPDRASGNNIRRNDCGYGTSGGSGHRGCMLTMKLHNLFPPGAPPGGTTALDSQVFQARSQIFQTAGRAVPSLTLY